MLKKFTLLVLTTIALTFVACNKDAKSTPAPSVQAESLPAAEAQKQIESEDDLKVVVKNVFQDEGLNSIVSTLIPSEDEDSNYNSFMRAVEPATLETVKEEIYWLIEEYKADFDKFSKFKIDSLKINEELKYNQINIVDGIRANAL